MDGEWLRDPYYQVWIRLKVKLPMLLSRKLSLFPRYPHMQHVSAKNCSSWSLPHLLPPICR